MVSRLNTDPLGDGKVSSTEKKKGRKQVLKLFCTGMCVCEPFHTVDGDGVMLTVKSNLLDDQSTGTTTKGQKKKNPHACLRAAAAAAVVVVRSQYLIIRRKKQTNKPVEDQQPTYYLHTRR